MKVTYNWLKEFVQFDYSPQDLANHLTMLGLEVELTVPVKPLFNGIVAGKILEIKPHKNQQKLLVCRVDIGEEPLTIICGAHNINAGDVVPVAKIDSTLKDNTKITRRLINGIESFGMLCSEKELGLSDEPAGIFILSKENLKGEPPQIGSPLVDIPLFSDTILDINITPNRPDALSVTGIAREIALAAKKTLTIPRINFTQKHAPAGLVAVIVKNKNLCQRYTARIIKGLKPGQSPFWLRHRLNLVGTRSINNVVDITNYILFSCGQPLHAFDYKKIGGNTIIIRNAKKGETILTIDNVTRILDEDTLVIADKTRPIAIAGIIGGKETEVSSETQDILLESASFNPKNIRRTAKKLKITTESSYRFERGVCPSSVPIASDMAAQLILDIAGGSAYSRLIDIKRALPKPVIISFRPSYCNRILGTKIPGQRMRKILNALGCRINKLHGKESFRVSPPNYRLDLTSQIDLIEETARVSGYPGIPFSMPSAEIAKGTEEKTHRFFTTLKTFLTGLGLNEIITYSFISSCDMRKLGVQEGQAIKLKNPISEEADIMRTTLVPGMLKAIAYNINNGNLSLNVFELGKCFCPQSKNTFPAEDIHLAIGLTGSVFPESWRKKEETWDFFSLKGLIETLLKRLFIREFSFSAVNNRTCAAILHPGRACCLKIREEEIGILGELHSSVAQRFGIASKIYIASIATAPLILAREQPQRFHHLPKFPGIRRDISIIVDKEAPSYDILNLINSLGFKLIRSVELFDLYEGDSIPEGKKSLAYAINYRHEERTLTDKEVEDIHNTVRQKIQEVLPEVKIRE